MGEAADAQQGDGAVSIAAERHQPGRDHQKGAHHHGRLPRRQKPDAKALHEERGQIAAQNAPKIGRQKGHPGEQGDLFQVPVAFGHQIERNPKIEGLPSRFGQKPWNGDSPIAAGQEDAHPGSRDHRLFQPGAGGGAIEAKPGDGPQKSKRARGDEGGFPAIGQGKGDGHRGREHGAERCACIEPADGLRALFRRKPLGNPLHAAGNGGGFAGAQEAPRRRQTAPSARQGVGGAGERPDGGEEGESESGAQPVQHPAANRLHHRIGDLKGAHDVGIFLGAEMHLRLQLRGEDGEAVAGQVVDGRARRDQGDNSPGLCPV